MNKINKKEFANLAATSSTPGEAATRGMVREAQESEDQFAVMHNQRKPEIAMLLYPGLTLMDLLGPQTALAMAANVHLVWKTRDLVMSDSGVAVRPDMTFDECPTDLDAIFVGGGPGQIAVMQDPETLRFLADYGRRAQYVTSVCSGSLILGAAGLLRGYKSTCHWAVHDLLPLFGAIPVEARVVTDRNRISGGGVTAGLDFGLVLLAKMLGEDLAKMTQLAMEYDPQPPFHAGTPKQAGSALTQKVMDWLGPLNAKMKHVCEQASQTMLA